MWSQHLARDGLEPGDRERYQRALDLLIDRAAHALIAGPPGWLDDMLGARPTDPIGATTWHDTVHQIAAWRTTHGVSSHQSGLGNAPTTAVEYEQWSRLSADVVGTQAWLTVRPDPTPETAHRQLSPEEIADRLAELAEIVATAPSADVGSLAVETAGGEPGADLVVLPLVAPNGSRSTGQTSSSNTNSASSPNPSRRCPAFDLLRVTANESGRRMLPSVYPHNNTGSRIASRGLWWLSAFRGNPPPRSGPDCGRS